jgi:hypothetical protein
MVLGKKMTMTNAKSWERTKQSCRFCGQYIQNEEDHYLIVVPSPWRKDEGNFIVHAHEWEPFSEGLEVEELFPKLLTIKKKRTTNKTPINEERVSAFKRVLTKRFCRIKKETSTTITYKDPRESAQTIYDKRYHNLEYLGRPGGSGLGTLMSQMVTREIHSRIFEEVEIEMGNTAPEGFRVSTVVNKAIEKVEELLK